IDPFSSVMSRVPVLKLKNVSAPMRVRVLSWKSNSDLDLAAVWRPRSSLMTSRSIAGCSPFAGSTTLTRLMILVTSADVNGPAMDWWVEKTQQNPTTAKTDLIVNIDIWRLIVIDTIIIIGRQTEILLISRSAQSASIEA